MRSVFGFAGGKFFEYPARDALQLTEASQVILEFGVHHLGILRPELNAQDHVAKLDRVRKQRVFLQFFKSDFGVVVIHKSPRESVRWLAKALRVRSLYSRKARPSELKDCGVQAAVALAGRNS